MAKKISTVSISSVNTAENSRRERLGMTTSKSSLFFSSVNFFWLRRWESVATVFSSLCWLNTKWTPVKIGRLSCVLAAKAVSLIIFLSNFVSSTKGVLAEISWIRGYCSLSFPFRVISDLPLVKTIWFCSISLKSRVTSGRLDTTLIKKEASRRIEPKEVINKPASSFFWEIKFSIEIWPFEPIKVTPSLVTSIFTVDKIGIAFLELIALLVVFNACRNKFLLIEKWIMDSPLFIFSIRRIIVIIESVKSVENRL